MARHRARRQAMQVLFEWDMRKSPLEERGLEEILMGYYTSLLVGDDSDLQPRRDEFAVALARGVVASSADIDEMITKHAEHWKIARMPTVDRNILRIAVYEMMRTDTPPAVVIDEALELARQFSGEESVHFVNGVLDAVRREVAKV
jgi:N utilization substance protein B